MPSDDSLRDTVTALRAVRGSGWKDIDDPLAELDDLRRDANGPGLSGPGLSGPGSSCAAAAHPAIVA